MAQRPENERDRRRADGDELIIDSLAAGWSYDDAAAVAGVSARTVRRRMSELTFAAEVSARRGERVGELTGRIVGESGRALDVILARLDSPSEQVQLRAAELVLSWGVRLRSGHELEQRLEALDQSQRPGPGMDESSDE